MWWVCGVCCLTVSPKKGFGGQVPNVASLKVSQEQSSLLELIKMTLIKMFCVDNIKSK